MTGRLALPVSPFVYAIIDSSMLGERSLTDWVRLLGGDDRAALIQWRFKGLPDNESLAGAHEMRGATREAGVLFFVNDRPDIARIVGADGVHVGQDDMDPRDVRALLPDALIGVSTHNETQFKAALDTPVDYIAVGPVFATTSKTNPDPVVGLDFVRWASRQTDRPVVGIGGINATNANTVVSAGASGVSAISELLKSPRPDEAARALKAALLSAAR